MSTMDDLPITLLDLLSNTLILHQTAPYMTIRSILALSGTSKSFQQLVWSHSEVWRHLDLSTVKSAIIDSSPIDIGGVSWRAERMDESLTEDDFYAGPLRGIFGRLKRHGVLSWVQTLVLDGLSVPADLVREIVSEDRYNVRVLSIREAKSLNQSKLQQVLRYACRPTRAEGTPKLKALYFFGPKDGVRSIPQEYTDGVASRSRGVMSSEGAQIGAEWNQRSTTVLNSTLCDEETKWYGCTGRALRRPQSEWPDTLQVCRGLIAFDAVLCRGPRHDITKVESKDFFQPTIATVALGPNSCEMCKSCPEGPAILGECPDSSLPLLGPQPLHSSTVRAAQRPQNDTSGKFPELILRCEDCLRGRWCEQCNRWWCESCYEEPVSRMHLRTELQQVESRDELRNNGWEAGRTSSAVKVIGVHRDCFGCGRTCEDCKAIYVRQCRSCTSEFCLVHDEGCSKEECAWCSHSGRRTRGELY